MNRDLTPERSRLFTRYLAAKATKDRDPQSWQAAAKALVLGMLTPATPGEGYITPAGDVPVTVTVGAVSLRVHTNAAGETVVDNEFPL